MLLAFSYLINFDICANIETTKKKQLNEEVEVSGRNLAKHNGKVSK